MMGRSLRLGPEALIPPARDLGIRYLIFHEDEFEPKERSRIIEKFSTMNEDLKFTRRIGNTRVYELLPPRASQ